MERNSAVRPLGAQRSPMAPARKPFAWLSDLPTTQLRICLSLLVIAATAVRYLLGAAALDNFGAWLTFLAALAGIDTLTVVGKRFTADPAVIAAEAAARQDPAPSMLVQDGNVQVIPQPGATQEPAPTGGA